MTTLSPTKTMTRKLTPEEDKGILEYLQANEKEDISKAIALFEEKFATPITKTHIGRIVLGEITQALREGFSKF